MENFTPYSALAGGILIGISATVLLLFNGRIAGISGIMNGALFAPKHDVTWRLLFLAGLVLGGLVFAWLAPGFNLPRQDYPVAWLGIGGFLVGFGTRMANGCTSGHAVCGIARLSIRSLAATATFIASGMLTVFVMRHILGVSS
ncbi:MAG: YeeE/YedE family protein [Gammaproteobacteria bacterium]